MCIIRVEYLNTLLTISEFKCSHHSFMIGITKILIWHTIWQGMSKICNFNLQVLIYYTSYQYFHINYINPLPSQSSNLNT